MATSSSRKRGSVVAVANRGAGQSRVPRRSVVATAAAWTDARFVQGLFGLEQWNASLPHCVLDAQGNCLAANERMRDILGVKESSLAYELLAERWPFFNEHDSSRALLQKVARADAKALPPAIPAESGLKTFRLRVHCAFAGRSGAKPSRAQVTYRLVVAEVVRQGDLLQDRGSRQALFRSLSHEIRTSVAAIKGYVGMLDGATPAAAREIRARMDFALRRLDGVVKRLEDFKAELGVDL